MELLYLWINQSENGVFNNQEVLLSNKYNINISLNAVECKVNISETESYYNIFENEIISNVSALVGANGTGKSTLLEYIYENDLLPMQTENRPEYQESKEHSNAVKMTLQVYEDSKELIIIHNLKQKIHAPKHIKVISINNEGNNESFKQFSEDTSYLNTVTKIYLTNGNYFKNNGYNTESGEPSKVVLSLGSIRSFNLHSRNL